MVFSMNSFQNIALKKWLFLLILLLAAACRQDDPTPTAEPAPTEPRTAALPTNTHTPLPPEPTETAENTPTTAPEPTTIADTVVTPITSTPTLSATAVITTTAGLSEEISLTPTTPTPTLTPTLFPDSTPLPIPTPWPLAENAISPENVGQIIQTGRLGWGVVDRLRYSPDGSLLAVATNLGLFLHDAGSGEQLQIINVPSAVVAFNFSPNGELMASGHNDGRIRIWQVSDGGLVRTIESETPGAVWSVAFSPDNEQIASAITNENGLIYIRQVSDGSLIRTISGHESRVRDVVYSPDGRFLASASIDWEVRIWNAVDGSQHARLQGHDGPVWRVAFTPDSQTLISAGSKGEVGLWQVENGNRIAIYTAQQPFVDVVALAVSPDGQRYYTAAEDGSLRAWDVDSREMIFELDFARVVQELTVSPDGETLAAHVGNSGVLLFDAETGQEVEPTLPYSIDSGEGLAYSPDGSQLLVASFWDLKMWSATADTLELSPLSDQSFNNLNAVVYDPNGRYFATGSSSRAFWLWDASNLGLVGYFPPNPASSQVFSLAVSGNGERLVAGWYDMLVSIAYVDANLSARVIYNIETTARVNSVALTPDGMQLFVGTAEGTIERWTVGESFDVPDLVALTTLEGHAEQITDLTISPDGSVLASADDAGQIKLWQIEDGALLAEIDSGSNPLNALEFSPDGQLLAGGGVDRMVRIWRLSDQRLLKTLTGFESAVFSLAFSPDGATLASGTQGAAVYLWSLAQ